MSSIENQIRDMVVDQQYNHIDKNMSIGCGDPFKKELARILDCYKEELLAHFELVHKPTLKSKREALNEVKNEMEDLAKKYNANTAIVKLKDKIQGFAI